MQRLHPWMRSLALTTAGFAVLLHGDRGSAQTAPLSGGPMAGMLQSSSNEELAPRFVETRDGQVYRIWQRAGDERTGGGAVLLARPSGPDAWETLLDLTSKEPGVNIREPEIAAGPAKELLIAYRWRRHNPRAKQVRLARSHDAGKTWDTPATPLDASSQGFDPQIAWGSGKTVVVVWADERRGNRAFDIYSRRSTDGGATWEPEQHLSRFARQIPSDIYARPRLVTDGGERFWAVWVGVRSGRSSVYMNRSLDGGKTWSEPAALSGESVSVFGQTLVQAGDRLLVVWIDARSGHDRLYSAASSDGGVTWTEPTAILHLAAESQTDASGHTVALLPSGEALVAWADGRNGRQDIFLGQSRDGGRTWGSEDQRMDMDEAGTAISRFPKLAATQDGRVALVWEDDRAGYEGVFIRTRSAGDHPEWSPETRVTPVMTKKGARLPQLLWAKDGLLYIGWEVWDFSQGASRAVRSVDSRALKLPPAK
jgi:Neuraminidase (sialidase)